MGNLVNRIVRKPRSSVESDVDMTESEAEENPRILRCSLAGKRGKNDPDDYDNSPRSKLKGIHSAKKIKTSMKSIALDEEKEAQVTKLPKRYIEFPNREQHLKSFLKLFGKSIVHCLLLICMFEGSVIGCTIVIAIDN